MPILSVIVNDFTYMKDICFVGRNLYFLYRFKLPYLIMLLAR